MKREELIMKIWRPGASELWSIETRAAALRGEVPWNRASERVTIPSVPRVCWLGIAFDESSCLGLQLKAGGKFHLKLNIGGRPIANKYREGKMKRTLKRE